MNAELTNLLPRERVRALRYGYFIRLATVGVLLTAGIVVVNIALLAPSYLFLHEDAKASRGLMTSIDTALASAEGAEVSERLKRLEEDAAYLGRLETLPTASTAMRAVLGVPRTGIRVTGLSYSPPTTGGDGKMLVTGTATTRDALRRYNLALGELPFVTSADLPISAYAADSNIPFTITLTGTMLP